MVAQWISWLPHNRRNPQSSPAHAHQAFTVHSAAPMSMGVLVAYRPTCSAAVDNFSKPTICGL